MATWVAFGLLPRMNPAIMTLLPPWTRPRVLICPSCESTPSLLSKISTIPTPAVPPVVVSRNQRAIRAMELDHWIQKRIGNAEACQGRPSAADNDRLVGVSGDDQAGDHGVLASVDAQPRGNVQGLSW